MCNVFSFQFILKKDKYVKYEYKHFFFGLLLELYTVFNLFKQIVLKEVRSSIRGIYDGNIIMFRESANSYNNRETNFIARE